MLILSWKPGESSVDSGIFLSELTDFTSEACDVFTNLKEAGHLCVRQFGHEINSNDTLAVNNDLLPNIVRNSSLL